jgi:Kelch motif/Galactose oxidase, central domain
MFGSRLAYIVPLAALGVAVSLAAVPASAAASGTFSLTGSMNAQRYGSTATLLPDGDVLEAGGAATGPSAELYNPATGTWTATGSMVTPRGGDTATLLPDGQVLVAGGGSASGLLSSAELYNPATGTWTATGSMTTAREGQSATLLPNGQVLVAGGNGASGFLSSAELYNPATGTWTATGSMETAREDQGATLLGNGQVLVAGGYNSISSAAAASAELYNPATGKFTPTGTMNSVRANPAATLLPDGEVLVTGGVGAGGLFAELYNPATGTWTAATSGAAVCTAVQVCHLGSTATLLGTGNVLVTGGYSDVANTGYNSDSPGAMLYDPATNVWTRTGSMSTARVGHTASLLPDGQVLVAGGWLVVKNKRTVLASAELYTP